MSVAFISAVHLDFGELRAFVEGYTETVSPIAGGVQAVGEAARYAQVWEWGNTRQKKKGPRTVLGVNPDGDAVWLSSQAPMGYVSIHMNEFLDVIDDATDSISFENGIGAAREELINQNPIISERIAEIIRDSAPVDSGQLVDSIQPMSPDDADLFSFDAGDSFSF